MASQRPKYDGIHNDSFLKHKTPTLQNIEKMTNASVWLHHMD